MMRSVQRTFFIVGALVVGGYAIVALAVAFDGVLFTLPADLSAAASHARANIAQMQLAGGGR